MFAQNQVGSYSKYLRYMSKTTIIELSVGKYALLYGMAHMPGARIIATTQREGRKYAKSMSRRGRWIVLVHQEDVVRNV